MNSPLVGKVSSLGDFNKTHLSKGKIKETVCYSLTLKEVRSH